MGTSSNQRSPATPPWRPALASLGRTGVPVSRQSAEVWRAASRDRDGRLLEELGSPVLAEACRIAAEEPQVVSALQTYDNVLSTNRAAGLALDMGKRALARAVVAQSGASGFASELFAEVASYYVSRDLPSFTARTGRISTTSEAIALKDNIKQIARSTAAGTENLSTEPAGWQNYVGRVMTRLQTFEASV